MHTQLIRINESTWRSPIDPSYGTFLGAFGGWTCAAGVLAASELVDNNGGTEREPLALTINFIGPVRDGFLVIEPSIVANTKSTTHVFATAWNEKSSNQRAQSPAATMSLVFAKRRSGDQIEVIKIPEVAPPEAIAAARFADEKVSWPANYDQRMVMGLPFTPNAEMRSLTWTRNADLGVLTYARLAAMADASVPRIFFHYPTVSPISTVTMTVQFHCNVADLQAVGNDFVLIDASSQVARHGHFDQQVRLFSRSGLLLATSTQLVWFDVQSNTRAVA
jgi:hypothetical protein